MLPSAVNQTLVRLCSALEIGLPGMIQSVYVYGSAALGAYIEQSSDIDFIAIVRSKLDATQIRAIAEAHAQLEQEQPGTDIMGAYLTREQIGQAAGTIGSVPAYFNNKLHTDGKGTDLNPVTWWILKHNGICAYGETIPFEYETPIEALIDYVLANMNSYWLGWVNRLADRLDSPESLQEHEETAKRLDEAVEWCTLGMLRQLYTIREHGVTSKLSAGEYGLRTMPERYHELIREAVAIKRREPLRYYSSQRKRLNDLVALLRTIHAECNRRND